MNPSPYATAFLAFANTIYDIEDLSRLTDQLNLIERSLFKDKPGTISQKAEDYLSGPVINIFRDVEKAGLEPDGDQKQLQFLKDLVSFLHNIPQIKVTLAFEPTRSFVLKLAGQLAATLGKKIVIEVIIDESVIAGAVFEYKGRVSEQTLKNKLHEILVGEIEKTYKGVS